MFALAFLDSPTDWLVVLLIVLLLFGGAKLPELARSLGKAKSEFQKAAREGDMATASGASQGASGASPANDDEKTLRAARELGIATDGRSIADIKADIRRKVA
ncbi:MAG: twin-arginine translocase TatA/TatE family subunit [Thermoplasmatota archaeon]